MTTATPPIAMGTYQDWLVAWKEWARTRRRGKMAQFIVGKLEDNKQARWLNIADGKFELTDWHDIAKEWFKEKPRNSDQVDAPCMLRKGLPRAFPGLEEVKGESVKDGTQYRSRVFVAPPELLHEVMMYIQNGRGSDMHSHMMRTSFNPAQPTSTLTYPHPYQNAPVQMAPHHYSSPGLTNSHPSQIHSPPQVSNGIGYGYNPDNPPHIKEEREGSYIVDSPISDSQSPYYGVPQTQTPAYSQALDPGLADTIVADHHSPIYSEPASPYQHTLDVLQLPSGGMGQGMGQAIS